MTTYSKIWQLINGIMEPVNLAANGNALQVDELHVGDTSPDILTQTILARLILSQTDGQELSNQHKHDSRYFTESELGDSSATSGSDLIGDDNTYSNFTPTAATIKGALAGIDTALLTAGSTEFASSTFRITDGSEKLSFDLTSFTANRTITFPNSNVDLSSFVKFTDLSVDTGTTGSDLIGDDDTYSNFTPTAATVKGALAGIDAYIGSIPAPSVEFLDSTFRITNTATPTKKIAFSAAGISSSTTRTITMPDANVDLGNLTNSNISASASIALSKLASVNANRALASDGSGVIISTTVTDTELGYVSGVTSAIQTQINSKVSKSGDTMSGNLNMNSNKVTNLGAPTSALDAATKNYVDTLVSGLDFQPDINASVADASTTSPGTGLPAAATGQRYILVSGTGSLETAWGTITGVGNNDIVEYNGSAWFVAYDVSVSGEGALTWNRDTDYFMNWSGASWSEFGGLSSLVAGTGLVKSGNTLNVNLGAGIVELPSDEVGVDLYTASGLILTSDGTTPSTATGAQLAVRLDGSTLARSAAGMKVADNGITATQLATDSVTTAKIVDNNVTAGKLATDSVTTIKIADSNVTAGKLATDSVTTAKILDANVTEAKLSSSVAGDGLTGGAGTALAVGAGAGISVAANDVSVAYAPKMQGSVVAGESMATTTTFAVRYALNGQTAGRLYKADKASGSGQVYNVVGLISNSGAVTAGDTVQMVSLGLYTLATSDSNFAGTDIGKPVYLTSSGAFSVTAPTTSGDAVTRLGYVAAVNQIWVQPQFMGIN